MLVAYIILAILFRPTCSNNDDEFYSVTNILVNKRRQNGFDIRECNILYEAIVSVAILIVNLFRGTTGYIQLVVC